MQMLERPLEQNLENALAFLLVRTHLNLRLMIACASAGLLLTCGCETSFEPKGPFQEQLVVYSVLTTRSDTQYVRVYTTYNPTGFDPLENTADTFVPNARVTITDGSVVYQLRDTVIRRADSSRYGADLPMYVGYPFPVQTGKTYSLSVESDRHRTTATAVVPAAAYINVNNQYVMKGPGAYREDISATIFTSPIVRGYILRLFVEFEYLDGAVQIRRRAEFPSSAIQHSTGEVEFAFPKLTRRSTANTITQEVVTFSLSAYKEFLIKLQKEYALELNLVSATFILTQVESNLYDYYNIVNGFQDQYSIRTDLPDFTNIEGGVGLFGAMTEDSVVVDLR